MRMRLILVAASICLTGCGTVMHGSRQTLFIDSKPDGATASIACARGVGVSGQTPARLVISRKADGCRLTVEKQGYRTRQIELDKSFTGAFWANFAFSPLLATATLVDGGDFGVDTAAALLSSGVAFLVDRMTGARYKHQPNEIVVALEGAP